MSRFWEPRNDLRFWDLVTGHDGKMSLTKTSIIACGFIATLVIVTHYIPGIESHPSDTLVLGILGLFLAKNAVDNSKLSTRDREPQEK